MNPILYNAGKGFAILTGFTFFAHSRFMHTQLKTCLNPHPFFRENCKHRDEDIPPTGYF